MKHIFVAGHNGMVGRAVAANLERSGHNLITADRASLDLRDKPAVSKFFKNNRIDAVVLAAATVGGIHANNRFRSSFITDNLEIQTNVIMGAHENEVDQLIFLGSSCIYPRLCEQPIKENFLLTSELEITNRPYAIAKIAGLELVNALVDEHGRKYLSLMPTNLYGTHDNFHLENGHVLPSLMHRFHLAKVHEQPEVKIWGSGSPRREFLHVDDFASAITFLMDADLTSFYQAQKQSEQRYYHLNVGSGQEISIADLSKSIMRVSGYKGKIDFDPSKPDGTPRKLLDSKKLTDLGWQATINLEKGLNETYQWFLRNYPNLRGIDDG